MKLKFDANHINFQWLLEESKKTSFSLWNALSSAFLFPFRCLNACVLFLLARFVTHITLNPYFSEKQKRIQSIDMSGREEDEIVVVNLNQVNQHKSWHDFFRSLLPKSYLTHQRLGLKDKAHIDTLIEEVNALLEGRSTVAGCKNRTFQPHQIHWKGIEHFTPKAREYFLTHVKCQPEDLEAAQAEAAFQLNFFSLATTRANIYDSIEVLDAHQKSKAFEDRKFVITCLPRDQNYMSWLKEFKETAIKLGATVIGFNYRGVDLSDGFVWTEKDMVDDIIAQVERVLALHPNVNPENVVLEGMCLGAAAATLAAAELHERGIKVRLYNERGFYSLPQFVKGMIGPSERSSWFDAMTYIRAFLGFVGWLIATPILWLSGWQMNVFKAWGSVPNTHKDWSVVHDVDSHESEGEDGIIHYDVASLASGVVDKHAQIKKKLKSQLTEDEWFDWVDEPAYHFLKAGPQNEKKPPHFLWREKLLQKKNKTQTGHDHFISSCKQFFKPVHQHTQGATNDIRRPLVIASSGGGGHISAAQGIVQEGTVAPNTVFPAHCCPNVNDASWLMSQIKLGVNIGFTQNLRYVLASLARSMGYPALPDKKLFYQELKKLQKKQLTPNKSCIEGRQRHYVDMLLDICPGGYAAAAFHNALQLEGLTDDINQMVACKAMHDKATYSDVFEKMLNLLIKAAEKNEPYTEIVSTQVLSWGAMCDAVYAYNHYYIPAVARRYDKVLPAVKIEQYVTELPSKGCTDFYSSIHALTKKQSQVMRFHVVYKDVFRQTFDGDSEHLEVVDISPRNNSMVRSAFKSTQNLGTVAHKLDKLTCYDIKSGTLIKKDIDIPEGAVTASVMLGSLASDAMVDYVLPLLKTQHDKIFLFCGDNEKIPGLVKERLKREGLSNAELDKIVCLQYQFANNIAKVMCRSQTVIVRSGGLSSMEILALPFTKDRAVLIHQEGRGRGISWEDGNADTVIHELREQGGFAEKITCRHAERVLEKVAQLRHDRCDIPEEAPGFSELKFFSQAEGVLKNIYASASYCGRQFMSAVGADMMRGG